ncbi:hypothetical protein [Sphaerisporangium krabiense]|uniref:Uncharacterized protein n=1 Tax=Sphaerisporangium krabiense TaxID=763782 RepID=A0A7W9DU90_9ACTN|nr:hypothetical protein [Sphaerisporangium krabiense]MBB5631491.1 hypothetical protein [Sphaerisporangium krabiense]
MSARPREGLRAGLVDGAARAVSVPDPLKILEQVGLNLLDGLASRASVHGRC